MNQKYVVVALEINNTFTTSLYTGWCMQFTCAGMLLSRYTHLSMFSGIGLLVMLTSAKVCLFMFCKCMYMYLLSTSVYQKLGYTVLVGRAAEPSMRASVEEVQALPDYSTKGELPYKCYGFIITIIQL